jgi:hypothetical protein
MLLKLDAAFSTSTSPCARKVVQDHQVDVVVAHTLANERHARGLCDEREGDASERFRRITLE